VLYERFERLKARLEAAGWFAAARKRALPPFPRAIGIVTSPRAAALSDVLATLRRRMPSLPVILYPASVQGEGAAREIAGAIVSANGHAKVDLLIVCRGGGSIEDLWAFNDEAVARAIAASPAPVISAVGHETDFTIADFVADLRAPTPSAAAELVVREKLAVVRALVDLYERLVQAMRSRAEHARARTLSLTRRRALTDAARPLRDRHLRVDELAVRLRVAMRSHRRHLAHRVALATNALSSLHPLARISHGRVVLTQLRGRLVASGGHGVTVSRHRFERSVGRLQTLSPLAVLGRGYSLTRLPSGAVVRRAAEVHPGAAIEVLLHEGALDARVERVRERDERHQV
jgi:exodeoxyribonuclease VII large subunit